MLIGGKISAPYTRDRMKKVPLCTHRGRGRRSSVLELCRLRLRFTPLSDIESCFVLNNLTCVRTSRIPSVVTSYSSQSPAQCRPSQKQNIPGASLNASTPTPENEDGSNRPCPKEKSKYVKNAATPASIALLNQSP